MRATIAATLQTAAEKLGGVSHSPRLDAEILLSLATGKTQTHFRAWPEKHLSVEEQTKFQSLLEQRLIGHPIAHLTGTREFWSREFIVTPDVLIPRPETELLVERALQLIDEGSKATFDCPHPNPNAVELTASPFGKGGLRGILKACRSVKSPEIPPALPFSKGGSFLYHAQTIRIADLGTGSGAIAITLGLELPQATITALDLSPAALSVAAENATRLGASNIRFVHSDWFAALHSEERFDLIVSNPPYIAESDPHLHLGDVRFEPNLALTSGNDGLDAIRRIVKDAPSHLRPGGWLLFEHGYDQAGSAVALLQAAGFKDVASYPDLQAHLRVSGGRMG